MACLARSGLAVGAALAHGFEHDLWEELELVLRKRGCAHTWAIKNRPLASRSTSLTPLMWNRSRPKRTLSRRSMLPWGSRVPWPWRLKALPVNLIGSMVDALNDREGDVGRVERGLAGGCAARVKPIFKLSFEASRNMNGSSPRSPCVILASPLPFNEWISLPSPRHSNLASILPRYFCRPESVRAYSSSWAPLATGAMCSSAWRQG